VVMAFDFCSTCGNFEMSDHKCPPVWLVWEAENQTASDAILLYAADAQRAAERWAELEDVRSAEYSIVAGRSTPTLCVRLSPDGSIEKFEVQGRSEPVYSARKVS
jgi:hypothetical protein